MHARWLVDSAAIIAYQCPHFISERRKPSTGPLYEYWLLSRQRISHWHEQLKRFHDRLILRPEGPHCWGRLYASTIEEIFLADPLVRVVCLLGRTLGDHRIEADMLPIVESVLSSHDEVRGRSIDLLDRLITEDMLEFRRLHKLRVALENWTNTLLSLMSPSVGYRGYHFSTTLKSVAPEPMAATSLQWTQRRLRWQFMLAGCQQYLAAHCRSVSVEPQLNQRLHRCVFDWLQPGWIDSLAIRQHPSPHRGEAILERLEHLAAEELTM